MTTKTMLMVSLGHWTQDHYMMHDIPNRQRVSQHQAHASDQITYFCWMRIVWNQDGGLEDLVRSVCVVPT